MIIIIVITNEHRKRTAEKSAYGRRRPAYSHIIIIRSNNYHHLLSPEADLRVGHIAEMVVTQILSEIGSAQHSVVSVTRGCAV